MWYESLLYEEYSQDRPKVNTGLITKAEDDDDVIRSAIHESAMQSAPPLTSIRIFINTAITYHH